MKNKERIFHNIDHISNTQQVTYMITILNILHIMYDMGTHSI